MSGKVVLIGDLSPELDKHPTVVGRIPGLYVQANFIEALLDDRYYQGAPGLNYVIGFAFMAGLELLLAVFRNSLGRKLAAIAILVAATLLVLYLVIAEFHLYVNPLPARRRQGEEGDHGDLLGSLAKLTGDEQKAVKTAAFDLQLNPAHPSLQFHKLDKPKDRRFWSIRVNSDVRLIVHRTEPSLLLCYVGHHDNAYQWAERRRLETHPKTGAAQFVEVRETVQEITIPKYVETVQPSMARVSPPKLPLFTGVSEDELLGYGVPAEWLADVRRANEDTLLELADHLPSEAAEALLDLATGVAPKVAKPVEVGADPFAHPDAQRRFRVMANVEELERALD
jgi:hypothetical protein